MVQKYTNTGNIPLSMAVFLATDNYDYEPNTISATKLLKPVRQLILGGRLPPEHQVVDIVSLVKSRMGSAIHDAIEKSWNENYQQAMTALGYPERVIDKIVINPIPSEVTDDQIPVYMEQRARREIMGHTISGKYDFVAEGRVTDFKSTSTFAWVNGSKDDDYSKQGSIYRWLNPDIITEDEMAIQFVFTDWMGAKAINDPNYPDKPVEQRLIPLMSLDETEAFIKRKLRLIEKHKDTPEDQLPFCDDKELWRKPPKFKYYKNPQKMGGRSTKNFDNPNDAYARLAADGNVGVVVEELGEVVACKYCAAFPICTQKDQYIIDGSLKL